MIGAFPKIDTNFRSDYGFGLSLPSGWQVLPKLPGESSFGLAFVEVFSHPQDPALSLTWMRSNRQVLRQHLQKFDELSRSPGLISAAAAQETVSEFFPLMGRAVTAFAVNLASGQPALEISEEIVALGSSSEPMRAYHLVLPAKSFEPGKQSRHREQSGHQEQSKLGGQAQRGEGAQHGEGAEHSEQGEHRAERAEHRAERAEHRAEQAEDRAEQAEESVYMQQLVFYARMSKFSQEIFSVIQAARSFNYL